MLEPSAIEVGTVIGRYVVLKRIIDASPQSRFVAYDPELDRRVELTILRDDKPGESQTAPERFIREAQALARVSHPHIVSLFDVGHYGNHRYLVTHWVDGQSLGEWLTESPRSTHEVLAVFEQAGAGLAAVHEAGVVHGAFNAETVVVDSAGQALLTHFALAGLTQEGSRRHLAPERVAGQAGDARSDQFSFCAALAEALQVNSTGQAGGTGRLPSAAGLAIERGLSADPERRFASMGALLEALRGAQTHKRTQLYLRAAIAALLVVGAGAGVGLFVRSRTLGRCESVPARFAATLNPTSREQVRQQLLQSNAPYAKETAARVDEALASYGQQWAQVYSEACLSTYGRDEQPPSVFDLQSDCLEIRRRELAALLQLFGDEKVEVDKALGATHALTPPTQCRDTAALKTGPPHPLDDGNPSAISELNEKLARVKALHDAGRFADGVALARDTLPKAREAGVASLTAGLNYWLGMLLGRNNDWAAADPVLLEAALTAQAARLDRLAVQALSQLTRNTAAGRGAYEESDRYYQQAKALLSRLDDDGGELRSRLLFDASLALALSGRKPEAVELMEQSLQLRVRRFGEERLETLEVLDALAWEMVDVARFDDAFALLKRAQKARLHIFGSTHPMQTQGYFRMGTAYAKAGRYAEAEEAMQKATENARGLNQRDLYAALAYSNLAEVLLRRKELVRAREAAEKSLEIKLSLWAKDHPRIMATLTQLGEIEAAEGRFEKALALHTEALEIGRKAFPKDAYRFAAELTALGEDYAGLKKPEQAVRYFEEALAAMPTGPGAHDDRADAALKLAEVLWNQSKQRSRARALVEETEKNLEAVPHSLKRAEVEAWLKEHPLPRSM